MEGLKCSPPTHTLSLPLRIVCELIWTALHSVGNHGHGHGLARHAKSMYYYCCCYYYGMIVMETIFCFFSLSRAIMHGIILGIPNLPTHPPQRIPKSRMNPRPHRIRTSGDRTTHCSSNSTKSRSYRAPVNPRGNLGRGANLFHIGPGSPACQPRNSLGPGRATRATGMNPSPPSPSPFDPTHKVLLQRRTGWLAKYEPLLASLNKREDVSRPNAGRHALLLHPWCGNHHHHLPHLRHTATP